MGIFNSVNTCFLVNQLKAATGSVIYVAPGLTIEVARVFQEIKQRIPLHNIKIIIDSSPNICRLGYGDIESVEMLINNGFKVSKVDSIRLGIVIVDGNAWVFSPVPLIIEDDHEVNLNGINVTVDQAFELIDEIYELNPERSQQITLFDSTIEDKTVDFKPEEYRKQDLKIAIQDLDMRPPKKFDLERQVQVYTGYFQFVELSLVGMGLRRRTINIPSKLLAVSGDRVVQEKLKATYKLITENSKLSGKEIEDKVSQLRKTYTRSLGKRLGSVILLKNKKVFINEVDKIKLEISKFSEKVKASLEKELAHTKKEISKILVPVIMKNPPDDLKGIIITNKPSKRDATEYIDEEISKFIPSAEDLITKMELQCDFKDITYEMLNDAQFIESIKSQFKIKALDKLYESYSAVRAKEHVEK
ncbi:hypothetical protein [Mesobacillus subterraneus]|uniref:hypothetical protein n=1 Tax=Mesobacillus subterraneus TaxID=285983 RepID=UPI001CFDD7DD|nr:hypothetical protein [Mesobacillus subterraneus]